MSSRQHPLRVYASLEAGIGVLGLLILFGMPLVNSLYTAWAPSGIAGKYANLGLSGSTMEAQDMAGLQQQTAAMKYNLAQQASDFGLKSMQLADTIYSQLANYQLSQDQQLQDALAQFAAAAGGGGLSYNLGGRGGMTITTPSTA